MIEPGDNDVIIYARQHQNYNVPDQEGIVSVEGDQRCHWPGGGVIPGVVATLSINSFKSKPAKSAISRDDIDFCLKCTMNSSPSIVSASQHKLILSRGY